MYNPMTPQRQVVPATEGQQLTPPSSLRSLTYSTPVTNRGTEEGDNPTRILREDGMRPLFPEFGQLQQSQLPYRQKSEGAKQQFDTDSQPKSEIASWLYESSNPEQRRRRFRSFLHGLWPSNDKFNAARHPFYDAEEDGPYDDFIKYQEWEGICPYDDDECNPLADPSKTTEVWKPKIGEHGIEDAQDLRMVLKARREQRARSTALKRLRRRGISLISLIQETNSIGADSVSNHGSDEGMDGPEPVIKMEAPSQITSPPPPCNSTLQTTIGAKGIAVFSAPDPSSDNVRRSRKKNKRKGRKSNKKTRGSREDPDGTYKYKSGSEDERPVYKKGKGKGKGKSKAATRNAPWKAQTRAAARRPENMSMDGSCDIDSDSDSSTLAAISGSARDSD